MGTIQQKKLLNISEIVFITVLSAVMGVIWWFYTFFYDITAPLLKPFMLDNLLTGVWFMGAVFFPYIVRKPGAAILGELIAAVVQGFIARWGISSIAYGLVQGVPVELFFLILGYRRWNLPVLMIAGVISALGSYILSFFWYGYSQLTLQYNIVQIVSFAISGAVLAGVFSKYLADGLKKTGVLNQFKIIRDNFKDNLDKEVNDKEVNLKSGKNIDE